MRRMFERRRVLLAVCFALAVLCAACTDPGDRGSPAAAQATGRAGTVITVGSFDFAGSFLLASIYTDALAAKGLPARVLPNLGTRELVDTTLVNGLNQLVPEFTGSAQDFMSLCAHALMSGRHGVQ